LKPKVYVDTTVFSLIVAQPSRSANLAECQTRTRDWWNTDASEFELFLSGAVRAEAARGDAEMARKRLELIDSIGILAETAVATKLGQTLIHRGILPTKASADALHLAITANENMDFLVTWNCVHLANGNVLLQVKKLWQPLGYNVPLVVTPRQLLGVKK
jgi:hypothetical protein